MIGKEGEKMGRPRRRYLGYIYRVINDYPVLKKEFDQEEMPSLVSGYTGMPGKGPKGDPVHSAAVRKMDTQDFLEYDAVRKAVEEIRGRENGTECLELIRRVHFEKSHTLAGAAMEGHMCYEKAKRLRRGFLLVVAKNMGMRVKV